MKVKDASYLTFVPYRVPLGMDEKSIKYGIQITLDEIHKIPERDMEEIVRCKDCKNKVLSYNEGIIVLCKKYGDKYADWFCADGERGRT